jgi:hypothetical protein
MTITARRVTLGVVLAVHLGVDAWLISICVLKYTGWMPSWFLFAFAVLSVPMAQGCLIGLWAATASMRFSLRLPLGLTGTMLPLIVFFWIGGGGAHGMAFSLMMITQLLLILGLVGGGRLIRRHFGVRRYGRTAADAARIQFSLRQMLIWTAVLALLLGTGKAIFTWLGWTEAPYAFNWVCLFQIPAVYNVLYALSVLGLFTIRVRWQVRILLLPLVVAACGALACSMPRVLRLLFDADGGLDVPVSLMISGSQIVYHVLTLWPLWLCGCIGHRAHADTEPGETAPGSDNSFAG